MKCNPDAKASINKMVIEFSNDVYTGVEEESSYC